jgi:hypothetical protein
VLVVQKTKVPRIDRGRRHRLWFAPLFAVSSLSGDGRTIPVLGMIVPDMRTQVTCDDAQAPAMGIDLGGT